MVWYQYRNQITYFVDIETDVLLMSDRHAYL